MAAIDFAAEAGPNDGPTVLAYLLNFLLPGDLLNTPLYIAPWAGILVEARLAHWGGGSIATRTATI